MIVVGVVCGFLFPAYLVEAIREADENKAKIAKNMACITFGVLTIIIGALIILCNL